MRQAAVVQDHLEQVVLQHAALEDLDRRDRDALLVDRAGVGRQRARHLAADVGHVTEHRRPGDEAAVLEDRHQHQPVVGVADRAVDRVRVGGQEDVALLDRAVVALQEAPDERAELADDHLAVEVGDQRELVVLLADARRHGRAEQHRVHLVAGVAQGALDDVEGDGVDLHLLHRLLVALDDLGGHVRISGSVGGGRCGYLALRTAFFAARLAFASRLRFARAFGSRRGRSGCCRRHPPCRGASAGSPRSSPFPSRSPGPRCVAGLELRAVVDRRRRSPCRPCTTSACRRPRPPATRRPCAMTWRLMLMPLPCTTARSATNSCSSGSANVNSRVCSASNGSEIAVEALPSRGASGRRRRVSRRPWPW